jgi:hypothetical protein
MADLNFSDQAGKQTLIAFRRSLFAVRLARTT